MSDMTVRQDLSRYKILGMHVCLHLTEHTPILGTPVGACWHFIRVRRKCNVTLKRHKPFPNSQKAEVKIETLTLFFFFLPQTPPATPDSVTYRTEERGARRAEWNGGQGYPSRAWQGRAWLAGAGRDHHGKHGRRGVNVRTKSRWGMVRENPRIPRKTAPPTAISWSLARLGISGAPYLYEVQVRRVMGEEGRRLV